MNAAALLECINAFASIVLTCDCNLQIHVGIIIRTHIIGTCYGYHVIGCIQPAYQIDS